MLPTVTNIDWRALQSFNLYRIILAFFLTFLLGSGNRPDTLGGHEEEFFANLVYAYLLYSIIAVFIIHKQVLSYQLQVASHVIIDIIILSLMLYTSGGLKSGFGTLMVISVACGSILSAKQIAILFAAIATIMTLGHEAYIQLFRYFPSPNYTQAGFLGAAFFITSVIGHSVSSRLKQSEALARERALDIESLAELNEQIIHRLHSGIIALDKVANIRLMNHAAKQILGYEGEAFGEPIAEVCPGISESYRQWQESKQTYVKEVHIDKTNLDVKIGIIEIAREGKSTCLIFLDDLTRMRQQAQSLKLVSLGRLTASIAHEIRNPLGAISHAGQLLKESNELTKDDDRLTEIIQAQSQRINHIIENILNMSRRQAPNIVEINLKDWLQQFTQELIISMKLDETQIRISIAPDDLCIYMDTTQLHQVLWNLSQNACRYSQGEIKVEYQCGIHEVTKRVYMDVVDTGSGMTAENEQHLFEPFYTTADEGTGLGLYISRELCEMNQASLNLLENSAKGCRFRIQFAPEELVKKSLENEFVANG